MSESPKSNCRCSDAVALYALGALAVAEALDLEAHLAVCAACRDELDLRRDDTADLGLASDPVEPPVELLGRLRERIRAQSADDSKQRPWLGWASTRPDEFRIERADENRWESTGFEGVQARSLYADSENHRITMMVRMEPGSSYPAHRHGGDEECYVVEGDINVGGTVMRAGDYQFAPAGSKHPVQSTEGGCLLLIVTSDSDEFLE